ncbi:thiol-disulfide isomerase and thioredoxin [Nitritalea halalkaliphila LW7]|uniref:Thiol-disulfide isomerase and thioredoxin n=1 Tax=Nitritalea halalkaliphila LW7 TaxID=1189621 RepID=I5C1M5_9BACT|nr:thioredoxin family protein [Nitritalea halalkaliphila]EIM75727.1 thiol-disulfide isomerase and thioredoxin [Nitritalea halalkaliphila LW7]
MHPNEILNEWSERAAQAGQPMLLLYFYGEECSVCTTLFPKVADLVAQHFPAMRLQRIDAVTYKALAAQLRMMSIPGILVLAAGKEVFRANGLVALQELKEKIARYYQLLVD